MEEGCGWWIRQGWSPEPKKTVVAKANKKGSVKHGCGMSRHGCVGGQVRISPQVVASVHQQSRYVEYVPHIIQYLSSYEGCPLGGCREVKM